jgi:signal transduction histidine kinase/CheY-like chemotaxis protein
MSTPSALSTLPPVFNDDATDGEGKDDTSTTINSKSSDQSKRSITGRSLNSDNGSHTNKSNSSSSHFEINCSPVEAIANEKSYCERMRIRRKQQEQPQAQGECTTTTDPSKTLRGVPIRDHQVTEDSDNDENDDASCSTLLDSTMSLHNVNTNEDTIGNSLMGSMNTSMNTSLNMSTSNATSTSQNSSATSITNSVSRGEEHIHSRMKKYGLVNIHEKKRKLQRRKVSFSENAATVASGSTECMTESTEAMGGDSSRGEGPGIPSKIRTAPLHVQMAAEEIHRWLFTEGGHFEDVKTLMTQYALYVREHFGIPLDRMFCGGIGLHPKLTAYIWQWEAHEEFVFKEIPTHIFARRNEIFSPDEPFCVLEQGRADHIRIRDTDSYIPPDTEKWFRGGNYKDYFALPDIHRGISKGGLAWSTKCPDGFCEDDIQFFRMTHAALTTIMRLHTNDLVLNTLTDRMESEIKERTNELAITNRKLEEANEEISRHAGKQLEHFACMSHEIRTPLNCIVGLSSLLLESEDLNEDLLDTIHMVYNSADLVQGVVNDVLDYAKIESGHFELDVRPGDLQTILNGVIHSISNKLQDKNVKIQTSYCGRLGKSMTTDSRRLQQILYNILGNAAKFSREGTTIDFKVRVVEAASENETTERNSKHKIRFSIKDYGNGIEEKNFEKIFQPFSQASKETQTIYGGTGLGLSITKNLVTRLGGTISVKSEIDKFTEFIVDLPYDEELVDGAKFKEKMSDATIVIVDPSERPMNAPPLEEDDFVPFPTDLIRLYDLNVLRCSSWEDVESKLKLQGNSRENYAFIAHEKIEEQQGILNVEKVVRRERCTWFTFGSGSSTRRHCQEHFKTLTGIFPSVLIEKICDNMVAKREMGNSISSFRDNSVSSFERSTWSMLDDQEEPNLKQGLLPPIETSDSTFPNSSAKSKKKTSRKYTPRALKVLIVDDNAINQKVLDRILKRLGVTDIAIVNNGKKAVDLTVKTKFDCIFMDMEMPVMGGLEACKLIVDRDKEAARVVFVTAHDIEDIRENADAAGADGYITKPLKMKDIHEYLKTLEDLKKQLPKDSPKKKMKIENTTAETPIAASPEKRTTSPQKKGYMEPNSPRTLKMLVQKTLKDLKQDVLQEFLTDGWGGTKKMEETKTVGSEKKRATPPKKRHAKQTPSRSLKILVAEDNPINQKVLLRILKHLGVADAMVVDNGEKAVKASENIKFDCILMDMQMPIMDGLDACKMIVKREKETKHCPKIVFVTAHALVEFKEKALAAGCFDFISKPFKVEDIDRLLKSLEVETSHSVSLASQHESATLPLSTKICSDGKPNKMPKLVHDISPD